jgi:hypothetical protein
VRPSLALPRSGAKCSASNNPTSGLEANYERPCYCTYVTSQTNFTQAARPTGSVVSLPLGSGGGRAIQLPLSQSLRDLKGYTVSSWRAFQAWRVVILQRMETQHGMKWRGLNASETLKKMGIYIREIIKGDLSSDTANCYPFRILGISAS